MRVRISSDGTPQGTSVQGDVGSDGVEDWEQIAGVERIDWCVSARDGLARATIKLTRIQVDVEAEATIDNGPVFFPGQRVTTPEGPGVVYRAGNLVEVALAQDDGTTTPPVRKRFPRDRVEPTEVRGAWRVEPEGDFERPDTADPEQ